MARSQDLIQGTLDLLILKVLSLEPLHGWAIAKRIAATSNDILQVQQGSLYPALYRLESQGWIKTHWGDSPDGRRAKFYSLTAAGRKQFERENTIWARLSSGVGLVLKSS
jgi:PadR family transcriptional regulator, regulatory protein PadR